MTEEFQTRDEGFLDVGLIIFLQPKGGHKNIRYKSSVVGWKTEKLVIIDMPILNGAYINLAGGCTCIIRYIYGGNAYGFEAKVLKNINDPHLPLVYLSYPQRIEKICLRKHKRVQTCIPVSIQIKTEDQTQDQSQEIMGNILDLSEGGCLLDINHENALNLKVETTIDLSFNLTTGEKITDLQAIVRRIQSIKDTLMVGVQFSEVSSEQAEKIRQSYCEPINSIDTNE